jgi:type VI secretion system protein ImpG
MPQPIEGFLERELLFLEETAAPFAERYPANAKHLVAETGRNADPHLERLIEGFALLAGRIRHKIDSEFPELTESLLQILYPHLGLIIPSMVIAQASAPDGYDARQGLRLDKNTPLRSQAFGEQAESLQYSLGYPVTVWPIELTRVSWETSPFELTMRPPQGTVALLRLQFACQQGVRFEELPIDKVRLYLSGERQLIAGLYEILFNRCLGVAFQAPDMGPEAGTSRPPLRVPAQECLAQVGLDLEEGLLPFPSEAFVGYRLLMELLSFPQKYQFMDVGGWNRLRERRFGSHVEVILFFSQTQENLERGLSTENFALNCAPVVNLFEQSCDPIDHHHLQTDYRIVASRRQPRGTEVYLVDSVRTVDAETGKIRDVQPFYTNAFAHTGNRPPYYHVTRRESLAERDLGTEMHIAVVDPEFHPSKPQSSVLDIRAWCSNRDLAFKYQQAGDRLVPIGGGVKLPFTLLHKPTHPLRAFLRRGTYWRLLGQSCLNHVSLAEGRVSLQALQELMSLCDFSGPATPQLAAVNLQIIEGIKAVRGRAVMERIKSSAGKTGACRGTEIRVEFDEEKYTGTGVFLVASVLERFFAFYTGVNSFTRLIAKTAQAEGSLKTWPSRAGATLLL